LANWLFSSRPFGQVPFCLVPPSLCSICVFFTVSLLKLGIVLDILPPLFVGKLGWLRTKKRSQCTNEGRKGRIGELRRGIEGFVNANIQIKKYRGYIKLLPNVCYPSPSLSIHSMVVSFFASTSHQFFLSVSYHIFGTCSVFVTCLLAFYRCCSLAFTLFLEFPGSLKLFDL